jgi:hypothetical protein
VKHIAVASYLGFGTLCGSLGAQCFIFSASIPVEVRTNTQTYRETYRGAYRGAFLVPWYPSKSGLIHKRIVKHIGNSQGGQDGAEKYLAFHGMDPDILRLIPVCDAFDSTVCFTVCLCTSPDLDGYQGTENETLTDQGNPPHKPGGSARSEATRS